MSLLRKIFTQKTNAQSEQKNIKYKKLATLSKNKNQKNNNNSEIKNKENKKKHPQSWSPLEIRFYLFLAPLVFWPAIFFLLMIHSYSSSLPSLDVLKNFDPPTISYIYSDDLTTMAELYKEHRTVTPFADIPVVVINAFLAAEDTNFYEHPGIYVKGIVRAFLANLKAGKVVQGASTITQQVVKTFILTDERTYKRKFQEVLLAWRVEQNLSKNEILFLYLNRIYLGRGAYGVESAAQLYFGKKITELTLPEAAYLAGLVKAPGRMGANLSAPKNIQRQNYIIKRMAEFNFITPEEAHKALEAPLYFLKNRPNLFREIAPQFSEVVRQQANYLMGNDSLLNDGLKIYSTIDLVAQSQAQEAVKNGLMALTKRQRLSPIIGHLSDLEIIQYQEKKKREYENRPLLGGHEAQVIVTGFSEEPKGLEVQVGDELGFIRATDLEWLTNKKALNQVFKKGDLIIAQTSNQNLETDKWDFIPSPPPDLHGALVLIENKTGHVKALVGGRDFNQSQFNRAIQAKRQPGSSFKPIIYAAAIDNGYTQASVLYDEPISYDDNGKIWQPKNYGGRYSGAVTVYQSLLKSINIISVKLCEAVSPEVVVEYAKKMGINSPLTPSLSIALGASEVTLLELSSAFTTFPNNGSWVWPIFIQRIENSEGQTLVSYEPYLTPAISPETAYIVLDMLVGATQNGTAARVGKEVKHPVGGKTGTSNDQADTWFIGFTPEYTCGIWIGRDLRIDLGSGEQGGRTAAPVFIEFMNHFLENKTSSEFIMPDGVVREKLAEGYDEFGNPYYSNSTYVFRLNEVGVGLSEAPTATDYDDNLTQDPWTNQGFFDSFSEPTNPNTIDPGRTNTNPAMGGSD